MKNPRRAAVLCIADAAYIAGLIDGEGTITLVRKHAHENRHLSVTISSTERQVLDFVHGTIGVGKITGKRTYKSHHRPAFTYGVYNRQALQVLKQIDRFLRTYKAERSKLALRDYIRLTPRNGKYSPELKAARLEFERRFLAIKP
ncbi:MAG: hypothetical protein Cons2KO_07540 [Congregibacter sp.]